MMLKNFVISYSKKGFTLAEVLITLVIVGVVAAMTIPTLVNKTEERELKAALKKNASIINQVLDKYYLDNGIRLTSDIVAETYGSTNFYGKLHKYFVSLKKHPNGGYVSASNFGNIYKTYNGNEIGETWSFDDGQVVLPDGAAVFFNNDSTGVFVSVDVNGFEKRPNRLGKDLFMFQLNSDGYLVPMGVHGTKYTNVNTYCSKTSSSNMNGAACTHKVLTEN